MDNSRLFHAVPTRFFLCLCLCLSHKWEPGFKVHGIAHALLGSRCLGQSSVGIKSCNLELSYRVFLLCGSDIEVLFFLCFQIKLLLIKYVALLDFISTVSLVHMQISSSFERYKSRPYHGFRRHFDG